MGTHITYGPGGFDPGKPNSNIVETVEVPDVVVDEQTIEDRLAALEAKTADLPDKAQGRG